MLYMHYCKKCDYIYRLNGHRIICPKCTAPLVELKISYLDYAEMGIEQREVLLSNCRNDEKLKGIRARYRMYKYSKWYKELQKENIDNLPVSTLLADKIKKKCG